MNFNIQKVDYTNRKLIHNILTILFFLKCDYPDFYNWYMTKVIPGLENGSRQIFVVTPVNDNSTIAAVMILKNCKEEKKISTLCVLEQYRLLGIGSTLLKIAFDVLKTNKPIITVSSTRKNEFNPLLEKYGFEHYEDYPDYYKTGNIEHTYNGYLDPQNGKKSKKLAG